MTQPSSPEPQTAEPGRSSLVDGVFDALTVRAARALAATKRGLEATARWLEERARKVGELATKLESAPPA